jgi:hypothetical protein
MIRNWTVYIRYPVYKEMWVNILLSGLRCYPFSLLGGCRIEVGKYCLSIEHAGPENCCSSFIRNTVNYPTIYTCLNLEHWNIDYRGADKSLARPTSRYILFDGENISFDASLVIYV